MYAGSKLNTLSISRPYSESCSSDDFIEIYLCSDKKEKLLGETLGADNKMDLSFPCEPVVSPLGYGINLVENDAAHNPHSSLSAKIKMPHSQCTSESDSISSASSRTRFTPIRKMFDPFMKSSLIESTRRNKTFRKSLLHDFSRSPQNTKLDSDFVEKDGVHSPVHLHGCLKLGAKHGVPYFKFSMNEPEEVFLAKASKADNAFNWVYTFHSVDNKKKSKANIPELSDLSKAAASIVAQMQVSCRLCSEINDGGDVKKCMVTEFVLYDTTRARQQATFFRSADDHSNVVRLKDHINHTLDSDEVEFRNGIPVDLHPNLEIASIVIQVSSMNRESLRYRRGDKFDDKRHLDLLNVSMIEESKSKIQYSRSQEKVKVIIPTGNHGFPCAETRGLSSLLDRWRFGGGCDCGGWDMACPLGAKENTPALTMTAIEGGYAIDFHAKLSALQAFSICVVVLHCTETSATVGEMETKRSPQYNSLKKLIDEEVKFLIKAVTEEKNVSKVEAVPASYVINLPFSPVSIV
ncbi:Mitochondrial substrate carrier family protein isoform 1 [Hibiscus syriacus]|uniref:Mitochondrial substrate carrier family protein isoform 1 n=1 Tax=Hibiscus syriacus TaxID=106335 RepID=A0A6A2ZT33_HIBSY|nr:Mitochondrial substrate carrier family protein isoform 1 [Hibiscus syriacus]